MTDLAEKIKAIVAENEKAKAIIAENEKNKFIIECIKGNEEILKETTLYELYKQNIPITENVLKFYILNQEHPFSDGTGVNIDLVKFILNSKLISREFIYKYIKYIGICLIILYYNDMGHIHGAQLLSNNIHDLLFNEDDAEFLIPAIKSMKYAKPEQLITDIFHSSPDIARQICYNPKINNKENYKYIFDNLKMKEVKQSKTYKTRTNYDFTNYLVLYFKCCTITESVDEKGTMIDYLKNHQYLGSQFNFNDWNELLGLVGKTQEKTIIGLFDVYIPQYLR